MTKAQSEGTEVNVMAVVRSIFGEFGFTFGIANRPRKRICARAEPAFPLRKKLFSFSNEFD